VQLRTVASSGSIFFFLKRERGEGRTCADEQAAIANHVHMKLGPEGVEREEQKVGTYLYSQCRWRWEVLMGGWLLR